MRICLRRLLLLEQVPGPGSEVTRPAMQGWPPSKLAARDFCITRAFSTLLYLGPEISALLDPYCRSTRGSIAKIHGYTKFGNRNNFHIIKSNNRKAKNHTRKFYLNSVQHRAQFSLSLSKPSSSTHSTRSPPVNRNPSHYVFPLICIRMRFYPCCCFRFSLSFLVRRVVDFPKQP